MAVSDICAYQKIISDSYDKRSKTYNNSEWHSLRSKQLVDYSPPPEGGEVLDIATGTGTIVFHAAGIVGTQGKVTGIDISGGMISKARELLEDSVCKNILFQLADAEKLTFTHNRFDRVYCGHAFFWMSDKLAVLRHWLDLLKPEGIVGFHAWPDNSFIAPYVAKKVLKQYGIEYVLHSATGNIDKCTQLLEQAGFENINIKEVKDGRYISLQEAKDGWINEDHYPIGQYPHPVANVPQTILQQARADYEAEMDRLCTDNGVWNNMTMYYVYGKKPVS